MSAYKRMKPKPVLLFIESKASRDFCLVLNGSKIGFGDASTNPASLRAAGVHALACLTLRRVGSAKTKMFLRLRKKNLLLFGLAMHYGSSDRLWPDVTAISMPDSMPSSIRIPALLLSIIFRISAKFCSVN